MQAVVYHGPGDIRVEERPEPAPAPDNLIVRVRGCCICGTDLKLATVGNPRCHPPRIIGHEMVGGDLHAGPAVAGFRVGERITLATTVSCGKCPYCERGLGNMCPNAMPISYDFDGAFAPLVAIPPMALAGGGPTCNGQGAGGRARRCRDAERAALLRDQRPGARGREGRRPGADHRRRTAGCAARGSGKGARRGGCDDRPAQRAAAVAAEAAQGRAGDQRRAARTWPRWCSSARTGWAPTW